jgi:glycosyltransferase involved in cell wall biosynthesis
MFGEAPEQILHGISVSNGMIYNVIKSHTLWIKEKNQFSSSVVRRFLKLPQLILVLIKLLFISVEKEDVFYTSLAVSFAGLFKSALFASIMKAKGASVIFHIHRGDFIHRLESAGPFYRTLAKCCLWGADTLIVLTRNQRHQISMHYNGNIEVLHNTIEVETTLKKYENGATRFLYLSNLIKEKGYQDLVTVFHDERLKDLSLDLAGALPTKEDRAFLLGITNNKVEYLGQLSGDNKLEVLCDADCLILPSYNEGQPISILEAMSRGMIIIATDVGCIREMLPDRYPFLFNPGDVTSLTDHILSVATLDRELLNELAESLQSKYKSSYSQELFRATVQTIFRV